MPLEQLRFDIRFATRVLLKNLGTTAIIVLSLALAIGGAGSAFTWLKAVWLNPLPGTVDSSRLLTMSESLGPGTGGYSTAYRDYRYFRTHVTSFSDLIAYELTAVNVTARETPQVVGAGLVSENYFALLGVRPILGRAFQTGDNLAPEASPVAVISYKLWRDMFGGNPHIAGSPIRINAHPFTVIGVAPKGFAGAYGGIAEELWMPMMMSKTAGLADDPEKAGVQIMGRLKPGVTPEQAQAEIHVLAQAVAKSHPEHTGKIDEILYPLYRSQRGVESSLFPVFLILMAAAVLVLFIASANVANLLLARTSTRMHEMGIRLALGATRLRLLRQLLTESLLLALAGGTLGVLLAYWAGASLQSLPLPLGDFSMAIDTAVDWRVLLFCFLTSLLTGLLFGFAPAVAASSFEVADALREKSRSVAGNRRTGFLRSTLVAGQVALSLAALVAAALFAESIHAGLNMKTGFDPHNLLLTSYDTLLSGYSESQQQHFYETLIRNLAPAPGVTSVSATSFVPMRMDGGGNTMNISIPGYQPRPDELMSIVSDTIAPAYLKTMRIALVGGREFTWQDRAGSQNVVVVNETMARRYWKSAQAAVGRPIQINKKAYVVAGVAADITYRRPNETRDPALYLCFLQNPVHGMTLVVRTPGEPFSALPLIERSVHSLDPTMAVSRVQTMTESMGAGFSDQQFALFLLSAFGAVALILTAIGSYGVLSYFVTLQTREIGVRLALGAPFWQVMRAVFARGMRVGLAGIAIGLLLAVAAARAIAAMIYGMRAAQFSIFGLASLFLLCVVALASYIPARRAMKIDPIEALRYE